MFPAGVFALLLVLLDPHSGETSKWLIEPMNYYQCSDFKMYYENHSLRELPDGSHKVVTLAACIKETNG